MDLFDITESLDLKAGGMELAATTRSELLDTARAIALELGRRGDVTADDVGRMMEQRGYAVEDLGPAAGSIFKTKQWQFTGVRVASSRKSNHGRELKVWRLKN